MNLLVINSKWIADNIAWILPVCITIGGGITYLINLFLSRRMANATVKKVNAENADTIIKRLYVDNDKLTESLAKKEKIIEEKDAQLNEANNRLFTAHQTEKEMLQKMSSLEKQVEQLTAQVNVFTQMFPDAKLPPPAATSSTT